MRFEMDAGGVGLRYDQRMMTESLTETTAPQSDTLNGLKIRFDAALTRLEDAALGAADQSKLAGEAESKLAALQASFDKLTEDFNLMRDAHEKLVADHEALKALAADAADRLDNAAALLDGGDEG